MTARPRIGQAGDRQRPVSGAGATSLLRHRAVWRLLLGWAVCYGVATWGFEAALLRMVPDAPREPWGGVYRLAETLLWVVPIAGAVAVAERWPVTHLRRQWRRVAAQAALGLMLGPAWGAFAYALSPYLMPWWHARGMWGVIAKEAKGALFGYSATAILAHVAVRVRTQRRRAVAAAEAVQREAEARLDLLRLELRPDAVLRTMDAIAQTIPRDVEASNEALVLLAETLASAMAADRARELPLHEELANAAAVVRLHGLTSGRQVTFRPAIDDGARTAAVPHRLIQGIVEEVVAAATAERLQCAVTAWGARPDTQLVVEMVATAAPGGASALRQQLEAGRGVQLTRERLHALFGTGGNLGWRAGPHDESLVLTMSFPWREVPPPATSSRREHELEA